MSRRVPIEHSCVVCARKFVRAEHLVRHQRTHTKEKPFQCERCPQSFSRRDLLKRHKTKNHGEHKAATPPSRQAVSESLDNVEDATHDSGAHRPMSSNYLIMPASETPYEPTHSNDGSPYPCDAQAKYHDYDGQVLRHHVEDNLDSYVQAYFMPEHLSWPEHSSVSSMNPDMLPDNIPDFQFFGDFATSMNAPVEQQPEPIRPSVERSSILSRPGSPSSSQKSVLRPAKAFHRTKAFEVTEDQRQAMQSQSGLNLPSREALSRFIQSYFRSFHKHQPFLHEPTWCPADAATPLVLAICANGALYSLEKRNAFVLYRGATAMIQTKDQSLWLLQTTMLLAAFAAWSGDLQELHRALQLQCRTTICLPIEWMRHRSQAKTGANTWATWIDSESFHRITYCLFTLFNLMTLAYDYPSPISVQDDFELPCREIVWQAETEGDWIRQQSDSASVQGEHSVNAVMKRLGDPSRSVPENIGMFACHLTISALLQRIMLFRRSCQGDDLLFLELRQYYIRALQRWQTMWECEPEASLSPDHPSGPILFNCTALLRAAYLRLAADYAPVRLLFGSGCSVSDISQRVRLLPMIERGPCTTRAALQACLAIKVPVQLGFEVVAKTSFWAWSVQHALCYFECALLLAQWLEAIENESHLTPDEQEVAKLVADIVSTSEIDQPSGEDWLPASVLLIWARLLDTGNATVWAIMPKMAQVLRDHAQALLETRAVQQ